METVQVPVDVLHWVLAILTIVALLVFLVPLRWRAPEAAPMAMLTAAIIALLAFRTPWVTFAVASGKGVWDAIFILYVIWPALLLYQVTKQAGAYDALRQGISRFSRNELFIILALSWVFSSFLQGIAGFGAPVAVVVPLLIAVGVKPVHAVAVAFVAFSRLSGGRRYGQPISGISGRPAMAERPAGGHVEEAPVMSLPMSFVPYVVLPIVTLSALLIPPLNDLLRRWQLGLPFPAVGTGYGVENAAVDRYAPITPLTHPGTMLLVTAVVVWIVYRSRGYYRAWGERHTPEKIGSALLVDAVPASLPIIAFLVTSRILDHSGQSLTIAYGIAEVSPPLVFAGIASVIGALGAFMTSSSTASNVLFAGVQADVAQAANLPTETIIAAQAAGSAYGNAIAPANIVLGTSIAGIKGQEGAVLRLTIPWTVVVAVLTGVATIILVELA